MVTHQLQVRYRTGKVRRSETDVLPLSYTTNLYSGGLGEIGKPGYLCDSDTKQLYGVVKWNYRTDYVNTARYCSGRSCQAALLAS